MRKMIGAVVVVAMLAAAEMVGAESIVEDTAEALYQRAGTSETNFADPDGYKRQIAVQGAGGDGASGDGGAAAGAGDGGNGGGSTGGDGCSR